MSSDKAELVRKIKAVMDETGLHESDRKRLSRELDARGISPLKGGKWGENSSKLGNWWTTNKHLLALDDERGTPEPVPQESTEYHSEHGAGACTTGEHRVLQRSE